MSCDPVIVALAGIVNLVLVELRTRQIQLKLDERTLYGPDRRADVESDRRAQARPPR